MGVEEGDAFVDIISDSADTFYDKKTDTWYYIFTEGYADNEDKFYSVKCSVSMKNDYVTPQAYAYETVEQADDLLVITFCDLDGNIITPEEFNEAGNRAFKNCKASSTAFDWFTFDEAVTVSRLTESYEIFAGLREPNKLHESFLFNIDAPVISTPAPAPTASPAPAPGPKYVVVTKNPTSEYRREGETAIFIATADNATGVEWTFVSPKGNYHSVQEFMNMFPGCYVGGQGTFTLGVANVCADMNGWGVFCTFSGNGQTARSSTAYITMHSPKPVVYNSTTGTYYAPGSDNYAVAVYVPMIGNVIYVAPTMAKVSGAVYDGCPCTVYYTGDVPSGGSDGSVYQVDVYGAQEPVPTVAPVVYNNTSGNYYASGTDNYAVGVYVPMIGDTIYVPHSIVTFYDTPYDGCPCTVYYTGDYPTGNSGGSVYQVDVYGSNEPAPAEEPAGWQCGCGTWNGEYDVYCANCGTSRSGTGTIENVVY